MPAKKSAKKSVKKSLKKSVKKPTAKLKKAPSKKTSPSAKKSAVKLKKLVSAKKSTGKKQKLASAKKSVSKPAKAATKLKKLAVVKKKPASRKKRAPILEQAPVIVPQESVFVDVGRFETEIYEPDPEVKEVFADAAVLGDASRRSLFESIEERAPEPPAPESVPKLDSGWDQNDAVGEEAVGGGNPTPDQDLVDELGKEVGLSYQDNEPLDTEAKLTKRDEHRWEWEPQSSEDFDERSNQKNDQ